MDEEMKQLLAKLEQRDKDLAAMVAKGNDEAKAYGLNPETKAAIEKIVGESAGIHARLLEIEQKQMRRTDLNVEAGQSVGQLFSADDDFKTLASKGRGTARMSFKSLGLNASVSTLTTSGTAGTGATGAAIAPDRLAGIITPALRRMTIRDLIMPGRTSSNLVQYVQETGFQNEAASVAEAAAKPQSDLTMQLISTPVQVLAHWIKASNQVLSDVPLLQSYIDGRLRYGLMFVEENQLLNGGGTGSDLSGLVLNATAFNTSLTVTDDTQIDTLRRAMLQVRIAEYRASAIVLNPIDWAAIETLKDSQGRYIFGNPGAPNPQPNIWGLPVVDTNAMAQGHFMTGAFDMAAQVFDREDANVQVSTEDADNFTKNLVTIRAEERLALAVFRPQSFVYGAF